MNNIGTEFLQTAIRRLKYYKDLGDKSFAQLQEAEFHWQPNKASNSIAVIIQHLSGNMLSRWTNFLTEDGEKAWRKREDEFSTQSYTKAMLLELWEKGWACFLDTLATLQEADLLQTIYIRGEGLTAIDAINRQLAHYPYHIGQIIYVARLIKDVDWKNLSIEPGGSLDYNQAEGIKDPAKKF